MNRFLTRLIEARNLYYMYLTYFLPHSDKQREFHQLQTMNKFLTRLVERIS